jgi:hypothetical protein
MLKQYNSNHQDKIPVKNYVSMCAEKLKKVSKVTVVSPTPETTATYSESKTSLTIYIDSSKHHRSSA